MREYELTYLVSDDVLEKDQKVITDRVAGIIANEGGKVSKEEAWGRRKLTYPINKQNFATYMTIWFQLPKEKIVDLEHELRVHPQIVRHLIVAKVAKGKELVVTKEDIVGSEDVEKIIGEKSFEQIEGQKEESYDLMAKRINADIAPTETQTDADKEKTKGGKIEKPAIVDITAGKSQPEADQPVAEKKKVIKKIGKEKVVDEPGVTEEKPVEIIEMSKPEIEKPKEIKKELKEENKDDEADPSRDGEAEADRIKKLDEKLEELLKDDL